MAKKLKTFLTSLGFFDQAVAAPSMKAALAAWGADSNLFHQGFAREVDDPAIVEATMAQPGVVLKRPIGSNGPFHESAELPTELPEAKRRGQPKRAAQRKAAPEKSDAAAERRAALAFEREQKKRDSERRIEQARHEKERARRDKAVAKAQAALDEAGREHARKSAAIDRERAAVEKRSADEDARWHKLNGKLEAELRRARS